MNHYVNWANSIGNGEFLVHKPLTESAAREPIDFDLVRGGDSK
ncbi:Uncharacterised protein [Mycobacteroides abscessus subsp. abscessus]|nr:hypothetical protein [Mycobacteroides abscessus]SHS44765.1 Uncharacterised protein [Mycobacteroides abscessus subsp. abscessus]SHS67983.1 Uncharacterised protein [Mycobacteroides abscessus subsp. abscessus]SHS87593.1 Uncharacterised protein [Mycobacteroides abscessus subsp. abscessus]SHT70968.1 Uncharacterised protein [Mycobacteroides abscessus subsp. abscessus]SHU92251.1 Uncharacterised protein [Mycobacteroides abscessus subsp. abscessus]